MTPERWTDIVSSIKDKFTVSDEGELSIEEEGGIDIKYIEFDSPMGKIRLEFVTKPVIIDKKTNYSKRIGSETQVDYIYSQDEKSFQFLAYKWDDDQDDWIEIESAAFDN